MWRLSPRYSVLTVGIVAVVAVLFVSVYSNQVSQVSGRHFTMLEGSLPGATRAVGSQQMRVDLGASLSSQDEQISLSQQNAKQLRILESSNPIGSTAHTSTEQSTVRETRPGAYPTSIATSSTGPGTLYVILLRHDGQQGCGMVSLSLFQCFLASLHGDNILIAEPQFMNSGWGEYLTGAQFKFSSLVDFDFFNKVSRKLGYPEVIDPGDFEARSPLYAVYVYIPVHGAGSAQRVMWEAERLANGTPRCFGSADIESIQLSWKLKQEHERRQLFSRRCVVRIVELWATRIENWNHKRATTANSLHSHIFGEWPPDKVTLLFAYFAYYVYVPLTLPPNRIDCIKASKEGHHKLIAQFRPSQRILGHVKSYQDMFLGGKNKLAIMIRAERVLQSNHNLQRCYDEVFTLKRKIAGDSNVLVTMDIGGKYGSETFKDHRGATDLSRKTLQSLYNGRWTVEEWEKSFIRAADGVTDRGYIAAIQRVLASRADCLVLVGGGTFQSMAVFDFMNYHNSSKCIHLVCVSNHSVQETINDFNSNR